MPPLKKVLDEEREKGVKATLEVSNTSVKPNLNFFVSGRVKKKQRPRSTKKFPSWAKPILRNDRICCNTNRALFEKACKDAEAHLKDTLANTLTERYIDVYITAHKPAKDSDSGVADLYDQEGIFYFKVAEQQDFGDDSESD